MPDAHRLFGVTLRSLHVHQFQAAIRPYSALKGVRNQSEESWFAAPRNPHREKTHAARVGL